MIFRTLAALILLLVAPLQVQAADAIGDTVPTVRSFPEIGVEAEVEIGQAMVLRESVLEATSLRLLEAVRSESATGNRVFLPPGVYTLGRVSDKGRYYFNAAARIRSIGITSEAPGGAGIFVPNNKADPPAAFWQGLLGAAIAKADGIKVEAGDQSGFRRELVYGGVAQGVVSISYREFSNDFARPAFTQDLRYDLSAGPQIGFRGARIEILQAGNTSIRYKVTRPLDEPTSNSLAR